VRPEDRLAAAVSAHAAAVSPPVLFYGHRPEPDGRPGRGCFSQWWPAGFEVDGVTYPTAEHWMMAEKARLFGDDEGLAAVLAAPGPGAAKAAGRTVRGFDEARWRARRYDIVVAGTRAKFEQHPDLARILTGTGEAVIAEASPSDRIWGIGLPADHVDAGNPARWRGLNLLGFALMEVRDRAPW
jgi:ribA/ribD-fused uncharacterized protein